VVGQASIAARMRTCVGTPTQRLVLAKLRRSL
jgi:hypothetical protein